MLVWSCHQIARGGSDLDGHQQLCLQRHSEEQHLQSPRRHLLQLWVEQLREGIAESQNTS